MKGKPSLGVGDGCSSPGVWIGASVLGGVGDANGSGVLVGTAVFVGEGISVACRVTVGVQVGGNTLRGVGVIVGVKNGAGIVGGGYGLIAIWGFIINATTPTQMHKVINNTITVRVFQIKAVLFLPDRSSSSE